MDNKRRIENGSESFHIVSAQKQNLIGTKIAAIRKECGMNQQEVVDRLCQMGNPIQKTALSKWETGVSVPNAYQLIALSKIFELDDGIASFGESYIPALNEQGRKKLREYKNDLIATGKYAPAQRKEETEIRYINMPISLLPASAGTGAFLDEGCFEMVSVPETSVPTGAEFGVRVSGDSMEPIYQDSQLIWIQECSSLRIGEVGLFVYDGNGYVKVYGEQEPEERETFTDSEGILHQQPVLISYNKAYAPKPISPDRGFQIVGRVLN